VLNVNVLQVVGTICVILFAILFRSRIERKHRKCPIDGGNGSTALEQLRRVLRDQLASDAADESYDRSYVTGFVGSTTL
jgi:hypothetical protein